MDPDEQVPKRGLGPLIWAFLNSSFGLLLISGVVLAGGAKIFNDWQVEAADLAARRATYVDMLVEYQRRVSLLSQADSELNPFIGEGPRFVGARRWAANDPRRPVFERASAAVGRREADILRGTGDYVPTAPAFARIDLLALAARMELVAGVPDVQLGGLRLLGTLEVQPDLLWLFVRAHLPQLQEFGVRRHMMYTNGQLPLPRGAELTPAQEAALGIPDVSPEDLERARAESNRLHQRVLNALENAQEER